MKNIKIKSIELYIKENEPKEEIMGLNIIDKSKCQWAWVGNTKLEVENKLKRRKVIALIDGQGIVGILNADEKLFDEGLIGFTIIFWPFYELIKEPKTKIVPMTFEDILCIPVPDDCVVIFKDKNGSIITHVEPLYDNRDCKYCYFNKKTKTYSEWLPLTKVVEVEE